MKHEFGHCIYDRDLACIMNKKGKNTAGMCEDCIISALEKDLLKEEKAKQLYDVDNE